MVNVERMLVRAALLAAVSAVVLSIAACSGNDEPVRIGLIAGLSGGGADLGEAGRNGAMLAVEQINDAGGIHGRPIELLVRDDGNDPAMASSSARDLVDAGVAAIVGPFNTTMTEAAMAETEPEQVLLFTPTSSALHLAGKDDYLFRLNTTTRDNAESYGAFMVERRGYQRIAAVVDQVNASFTDSWMEWFRRACAERGAELVVELPYDSRAEVDFDHLVGTLQLARPDAIMLVTNSIDSARIAQQIRKAEPGIPLLPAEWAATQQLIQLGGAAAEGMEVLQVFDRFDTSPRFVSFVEAYRTRFGSEPSYSSINAFESVQIIAEGLRLREDRESLKESIVAHGPYQGLQQSFSFDARGDTYRASWFVVVHDGEFHPSAP